MTGRAAPFRPQSARGQVTRAALVAAARSCFERRGFSETRVSDITTLARVATGSFYTYFSDKHEALIAVLETVREEMSPDGSDAGDDPLAAIERANRAYFEAYSRNAGLMAVVEHVTYTDPAFRARRLALGHRIEARTAAGLRRLQEAGLADTTIDPELTSRALSGMVSRLAFRAFVSGEPGELDDLVAVSTRLWANAIGLRQ